MSFLVKLIVYKEEGQMEWNK